MGKKPQKKANVPKDAPKKLSAQKRHELDQLIDKLFKLGFRQTQAPADQWNEYVEIQGILDRVQAIESTLKVKSSAAKNRLATIETFCKWCEENGAQFEGVKIAEFPGYELGLEASKDFKQNDLVLTVPVKMIMSEERLTSYLIPIVSEIPLLDSMTNVKLAFGLLLERLRPDCFWKPYIDLLPERHATVLYFSVNDMQELKGSNLLGQALNQCKSIARQYAFIHKCVQKVDTTKFGSDSVGKETFETLKEKFTYEFYR
ncbi:unnamed protein product [Hermetia illucens]|uniref:protein-histidine N-methyltransferase n=3 Tax=Hermetia illucens TaxID=343691 RepID=A0A7R8UUI8_HERIL|nr:unnamed protein product [Hermetia illucens]